MTVTTQPHLILKNRPTTKKARRGIKDYINIYNKERLHLSLDYLTPDEAYYKGANNMCYNAKAVLLGVA